LEKEQDNAPSKNSTEVLGELLSADGHGIQDSNTVSSKFQPNWSPVREGNKEVNSRNNEQEKSDNNDKVVEDSDQEEREEVVITMNELIDIKIASRTESISSGQVNTVRNWEGQQSSNVWNEGDSQHYDSNKTVP